MTSPQPQGNPSSVPLARHTAAVAVLAALSLAAASLAAAVGLPQRPAGDGREPMRAHAIVLGTPIEVRSGLVWTDGFGDVSLLLSADTRSCASPAGAGDDPHVSVWIHSEGGSLGIGRAVTGRGAVRMLVTFSRAGAGAPVSVQTGIRLVVTRIDTRANGVWHGRLQVDETRGNRQRSGFTGTFAARWCGQR